MSTYHVIKITTPEPINLASLPYPLYDYDGTHPNAWGLHDGDVWEDPTAPICYGHSAHGVEPIETWALEYTAAYPGITVTWSQEWDDEDAGASISVYRDGTFILAESKHTELVPDNLHELIAVAREALGYHDKAVMTALHPSNPFTLASTLRSLVDALDPVRSEL